MTFQILFQFFKAHILIRANFSNCEHNYLHNLHINTILLWKLRRLKISDNSYSFDFNVYILIFKAYTRKSFILCEKASNFMVMN